VQVEVQIEALLVRQAALQEERERLQRFRAVQERAPLADWAAGTFAWDQRVQQLLGDVFGLSSFRRHQREVINATLQVSRAR
jgi:ATP-dependent DNA helicase Q1